MRRPRSEHRIFRSTVKYDGRGGVCVCAFVCVKGGRLVGRNEDVVLNLIAGLMIWVGLLYAIYQVFISLVTLLSFFFW